MFNHQQEVSKFAALFAYVDVSVDSSRLVLESVGFNMLQTPYICILNVNTLEAGGSRARSGSSREFGGPSSRLVFGRTAR